MQGKQKLNKCAAKTRCSTTLTSFHGRGGQNKQHVADVSHTVQCPTGRHANTVVIRRLGEATQEKPAHLLYVCQICPSIAGRRHALIARHGVHNAIIIGCNMFTAFKKKSCLKELSAMFRWLKFPMSPCAYCFLLAASGPSAVPSQEETSGHRWSSG